MKRTLLFMGLALLLACQSPFSRPDYSESISVQLEVPAVGLSGGSGSRLIASDSAVLLLELITPDKNFIRQYFNLELTTEGFFTGLAQFDNLQANITYEIQAEARSLTNIPLNLGKSKRYLDPQKEENTITLKLFPHPESPLTYHFDYQRVVRDVELPGDSYRFLSTALPKSPAYRLDFDGTPPVDVEIYLQDGEGNVLQHFPSTVPSIINIPGPVAGDHIHLTAFNHSGASYIPTFAISSADDPADFSPPSFGITSEVAYFDENHILVSFELDSATPDLEEIGFRRIVNDLEYWTEYIPAPADGQVVFRDYNIAANNTYNYILTAVDRWGNEDSNVLGSNEPPSPLPFGSFTDVTVIGPNVVIADYPYDALLNSIEFDVEDTNLEATQFIFSRELNDGPEQVLDTFTPTIAPPDYANTFEDNIDFIHPPQYARYILTAQSGLGEQRLESGYYGVLFNMSFDQDLYQDTGPRRYNAGGTANRFPDRFGVSDRAVAFNGSNSLILTDAELPLSTGPSYISLSLWLAIDDLTQSQGIFEMMDTNTSGIRLFYTAPGELTAQVNNQTVSISNYNTVANPGEWKLITISTNPSPAGISLSVDGDMPYSGPFAGPVSFNGDRPFTIGSSTFSPGSNLMGKIDDFRIFSFPFYVDPSPGGFDDIKQIFYQRGWPAPQRYDFRVRPDHYVDLGFNFSARQDFFGDYYVRLDREISPGNYQQVDEVLTSSLIEVGPVANGNNYRITAWEAGPAPSHERLSMIRRYTFSVPEIIGMSAYWPLDSADPLQDRVSPLNTLDENGSTLDMASDRFGNFDGATRFNGDDQPIASTSPLSNPNLNILNTGHTWSFWMRTPLSPGVENGAIFSYDLNDESTHIRINDEYIYFHHTEANLPLSWPLDPVEHSDWTHVVLTWNTSNPGAEEVGLYLNGGGRIDIGTMPFLPLVFNDFIIGNSYLNNQYEGDLDDFRIFQRVLNDVEIHALYSEKQIVSDTFDSPLN